MSEPSVRTRMDGTLELIEPDDCDDPVEVALPLLRQLVADSSLVSHLRFVLNAKSIGVGVGDDQ